MLSPRCSWPHSDAGARSSRTGPGKAGRERPWPPCRTPVTSVGRLRSSFGVAVGASDAAYVAGATSWTHRASPAWGGPSTSNASGDDALCGQGRPGGASPTAGSHGCPSHLEVPMGSSASAAGLLVTILAGPPWLAVLDVAVAAVAAVARVNRRSRGCSRHSSNRRHRRSRRPRRPGRHEACPRRSRSHCRHRRHRRRRGSIKPFDPVAQW